MTANQALNLIGTGMRLRINKSTSEAVLVEGLKGNDRHDIPIDDELRDTLLSIRDLPYRLHQIQHTTENNRLGCVELGYDDITYYWYALLM